MSFRSVLMMIILRMPADKHLLRCHCNRKVLRNKQSCEDEDENQSHLTERTQRPRSWRWRTSGSARHSWWGMCPSETPISLHSPAMKKRAAIYKTKQDRQTSWWRWWRVLPPSAQSKWRECCSLWMGRSPEGRGQLFQAMCMCLAHLLLYLEHVRKEWMKW